MMTIDRAVIVLVFALIPSIVAADWVVAPNADVPDRPAYWVVDANGQRIEAILNGYRIDVGRLCLGGEVRPAGSYSLRWLDRGPNPLAGICEWVDEEPAPPDTVDMIDLLVTWDHNGLRIDGTPVELAGFTIHATVDGDPIDPIIIDDGTARSYDLSGAAPGHWCFEVVARDGANISAPSSPPFCETF